MARAGTPETDVTYAAARRFVENGLRHDDSLFTPGRSIWSLPNLNELQARFVDRPDVSNDSFENKFRRQLAGAPPEAVQLAAELLFVYLLITVHLRGETKREQIGEVLSWADTHATIPSDLSAALDHGFIHPGTHYAIRKPDALIYLIRFLIRWKSLSEIDRANALVDPWTFKALSMTVPAEAARAQQAALWHIVFPDTFEPIVSEKHKGQIAQTFGEESDLQEPDLDRRLLRIRSRLTPQLGADYSYYKSPLSARWRESAPQPVPRPPTPVRPAVATPGTSTMSLDTLSELTLWPKSTLEEILELFNSGNRQVVLAGPPGTSKTWIAELLAKYLCGGDSRRHRLVQFHPSYTYEAFVEGLRPTLRNGAIQFEVVPGTVRQFVVEMGTRSDPHILIVDEMNRANLPKVLGELMYLFEYRDKAIDLPYTKQFKLPSNLWFIGTMNTADRSIRSIDVALRRRFMLIDCPPDAGILQRYYLSGRENHVPKLVEGFDALNQELARLLDEHHTIGHAFFMADGFDRSDLERAWRHKIGPLIQEYFFDQPETARTFTVDRFWPPADEVMRTEVLTESRAKTIGLTDDEAGALVEAGVRLAAQSERPEADNDEDSTERSVIECTRAPGQDWRVVVRNAIGVIAISDSVQLVVEPKIPTAHLLYLFEVAGSIPRLSLAPGELESGRSLWDLIARWFVRAVQGVLRADLLRDYSEASDELRMVHGTVRSLETAQAHYSGRLTLTCDFDEFGPDTPLNRLIKEAGRIVVRSAVIQPDTRRGAQRVLQRFDEVGDLRPRDLFARVDRVSAHYSTAIALAKNILTSIGRSLEPGKHRAWTFLIRTPDLVEDGVRKLLKQALGSHTIGKWPERIVGSRRTLNPDLVIGERQAVADVKYKTPGDDLSRADLYQAVAFATGFGCDHAAIVAFRDGPAPSYTELSVGRVAVRHLWWQAESRLDPHDAAGRLVEDVAAWLRAVGL